MNRNYLRKGIIVDIDGTVATHYDADGNQIREHHDYALVGNDLPIQPIIDLVAMYEAKGYHIIFVSGRQDHCRKETMDWLIDHGVEFDELFMRKTRDFRPDNEVKAELYHQYIEDEFDIELVLDDRDRVVKMWRDLGLRVLQVAEGDF
jgi:acid phosphatase class B